MKIFASFLFIALSFALSPEAMAEAAQTVFINGNIYTMNERQPQAEAIAVQGG